MKSNCAICGQISRFFLNKDGHNHFLCSNCQTIFVYPLPENLIDLYSDESNYAGTEPITTGIFSVQGQLQQFLKAAQTQCNSSLKILDIGCSTGSFLISAREMGFKVKGVEPSKKLSDHAKSLGLDVLNDDFHNDLIVDEKFDVISCFDVIEHVFDPTEFINNAVSLMSPTSYLIIKTPNMNSLWARLTFKITETFSIPPSVLTPPHHVYNFTSQSLDLLANKHGLILVKSWSSGATLLYELGQLHLWRRFKMLRNFSALNQLFIGYSLYCLIFLVSRVNSKLSNGFNMFRIYKLDNRRII
jgi:2-polyprenyl-3-methyl-5-hydroxy-6-metoxy-1,4-benzoquinol methylase